MSDATPLPRVGEVFFDERGDDRALRLSWHPDSAVMVLSIWNRGVCTGTFRLPARDIPALLEALGQGLPPAQPRGRRHADPQEPAPDPVPSYELDTQLAAAVPDYDQPRHRSRADVEPAAYDVPAASYDRAAGGPAYGGAGSVYQSAASYAGPAERGQDGPPVAGSQYGMPYVPGTPQFPSTGQYEVGRHASGRPPAPPAPSPDALDVLKSLGSSSADEQPAFPRTGEYRRPPRG